ncbi:MAG: aminodeoxychorismate/anthranilate synthase component II, partial [Candidatus Electrothrix sp. MAN1_4]|nr:aminodeoxychorismate/anthranilate synthase component II [Candidatus Electrothrix sp. MAN1_4]
MHLLLIDNFDSFTYNLQHLIAMNSDVILTVKRNNDAFLKEIEQGIYSGVIIGPGPGSPDDDDYFGFNRKVILEYGTRGLPVLGICLGFQGIYSCFGGTLKVSKLPIHGKVSTLQIVHNGTILNNIPNHIQVMRYHSIMADLDKEKPDCLKLNAYTFNSPSQVINGRELMAIEHREYPIYGLQFHPESFATEFGKLMTDNF